LSLLRGTDSSFSIVADVVVFLNSSEVLITFKNDSVLHVFLDPVVLYAGVRAQSVLGLDVDSAGVAAPDFVHYDVGVRTDGVDADFTLQELAKLYFGSTSSLHFDSRTVNVVEETAHY